MNKENLNFHHRFLLGIARVEPFGLAVFAPGTWGSFAGLILGYFLFLPLPLLGRLVTLVALFFLGAYSASFAERYLEVEDPSSVVIDEVLGQWVVLLFLPFSSLSWIYIGQLIGAFILFRIFDIFKPFPIKASESWLPSGYGIMIDDVLAGFYGLLVFTLAQLMLA